MEKYIRPRPHLPTPEEIHTHYDFWKKYEDKLKKNIGKARKIAEKEKCVKVVEDLFDKYVKSIYPHKIFEKYSVGGSFHEDPFDADINHWQYEHDRVRILYRDEIWLGSGGLIKIEIIWIDGELIHTTLKNRKDADSYWKNL